MFLESCEMMTRSVPFFIGVIVLALVLACGKPGQAEELAESVWYAVNPAGEVQVKLHFFWSQTCPHCERAMRFLDPLARDRPWLQIATYEVTSSPANRRLFAEFASATRQEIRGVPAFFLCGQMVVGFDSAQGMGAGLTAMVDGCHDLLIRELSIDQMEAPEPAEDLDLPFVGRLGSGQLSLPLLTVILGGIDAFNPCAFFVLLFLLSLLVHARSRKRMVLVGGVFIVFSGLLYFVFMAAWLNLFLVLEGIRAVTLIAGGVAVALAVLTIKDFFLAGQGPSLSIPASVKPGLFARMRGLVSAESLPAMLTATVTLAIAANTYELLCTSGLPLVYTRALTLAGLSTAEYYLYLALYNLIYMLPLLAILVVFVTTLGGRRLSERRGRELKLLSGLMMLGLGLVLVFAPDLLDNWLTSVALLALALGVTVLFSLLDRLRARRT